MKINMDLQMMYECLYTGLGQIIAAYAPMPSLPHLSIYSLSLLQSHSAGLWYRTAKSNPSGDIGKYLLSFIDSRIESSPYNVICIWYLWALFSDDEIEDESYQNKGPRLD